MAAQFTWFISLRLLFVEYDWNKDEKIRSTSTRKEFKTEIEMAALSIPLKGIQSAIASFKATVRNVEENKGRVCNK